MGPTQAAGLVVQEQAKAEATRVAALRARGIAADPRPAMEMAEAQQVIAFLMTDGVTGAMAFSAMDLGSASSIADRTPGVPRTGRAPSRFCRDSLMLKDGMWLAAGAIVGAVALGWVTLPAYLLTEAAVFGFGASYGLHTKIIDRLRDEYC